MKLFEFANDLDIDSEMLRLIDECDTVEYSEYLIMSNTTFSVFSELSNCVNKKKMSWDYRYEHYSIAIDKGLVFGEVIIK